MNVRGSGTEHHDALTGLLNAEGLQLLASQMIARAARDEEHISLLCLRIARASASETPADAGETPAHADATGNTTTELLGGLSHLLRTNLRASDVVARTGPDELVALLPDTNAEQLAALGDQLASVAQREGLLPDDATEVEVEVEVGTSTFEPSIRSGDLSAMLDEARLSISLVGQRWS
jgi:GGDEF domain-containing protein